MSYRLGAGKGADGIQARRCGGGGGRGGDSAEQLVGGGRARVVGESGLFQPRASLVSDAKQKRVSQDASFGKKGKAEMIKYLYSCLNLMAVHELLYIEIRLF